MLLFRFVIACLIAAQMWFAAAPANAQALPPLTGPVVLTVTGLDPAAFPGGKLELDTAMLQAMGASQITTSTIWTDGAHVYTGVMVKTLALQIKSGNRALRFRALNDYAVDIPAADISDVAPILAYAVDDAPMSVRDKGPLWVIYPFDAGPEFRTDTIFTRSVWQVSAIEVLP